MKPIRKSLCTALAIVFAVCLSMIVFAACAPTEATMYEVTVNAGTHGSVTLAPEAEDGKYEEGTEVTVKVTPDSGYEVDSFAVSGFDAAKLDGNNEYKFKVTADATIDVTFKVKTYTITVDPVEHGKVELSPAKTGNEYEEGDDITITVTPAVGYEVGSFKVNGTETPLDGNTYVITDISEDITIDVVFEDKNYAVTVGCGDNGSFTVTVGNGEPSDGGEYSVPARETVVFTVIPAAEYEVSLFTINGNSESLTDEGTYTISVEENLDVLIEFSKIKYTVTVNCGDNGSYKLTSGGADLQGENDTYKLETGAALTFEALPREYFEVGEFTVSGDEDATLTENGTYEITSLSANTVISVTFVKMQCTVTIICSGDGTYSLAEGDKPIANKPDGVYNVDKGSEILFTALPNGDVSVIFEVVDDETAKLSPDNTYTILVTKNIEINVKFGGFAAEYDGNWLKYTDSRSTHLADPGSQNKILIVAGEETCMVGSSEYSIISGNAKDGYTIKGSSATTYLIRYHYGSLSCTEGTSYGAVTCYGKSWSDTCDNIPSSLQSTTWKGDSSYDFMGQLSISATGITISGIKAGNITVIDDTHIYFVADNKILLMEISGSTATVTDVKGKVMGVFTR